MKLIALPLLLMLWSCSNTAENQQEKKLSTTVAIKNTAESSETTADKSDEEFDTFLQRFSIDSSFQLTRIAFPVKVTSTDGEKEEVKLINKQAWEYTNYSNLKSGQIRSEKVKNGLINLIYTVDDTGVLVYHYFQKRNKEWVLVSIEDHST
ncbi:DUF4348 domain-containing protein [Nibribacter ruber]|uniref:DUF4348 domain-containing protein n=1 Tax=Nibribacter ruber TaxID=2698458 RepID=A0A6P1P407_9BACT|nr:DUF4348 domain-containing protein [Nibribacter ruber]QHL89150.1 DUF4348 domain-containing protein [Nibribacter ruber]